MKMMYIKMHTGLEIDVWFYIHFSLIELESITVFYIRGASRHHLIKKTKMCFQRLFCFGLL